MPTIQIEGREAVQAEEGTKLVLALEDGGVDILHRCGGNARCTTCAVEVVSGNAGEMSEAEATARSSKGVEDPSIRLSCQLHVHDDLTIKLIKTTASTGLDAGPRPQN
ncbi:2Fe-2S iron-sulfur cluster-binding protein [Paenibacillus sacheonensis]|uniref:2Fe-2S iron-sulfur cluster binding domain-containing protein n=1 Tax=Paenibacillus sacheonensis TaxID=742054 RepID=A0A7X4YTQ6_9BACL|nr:2Fe-2S iron-sulfur cluster-binding protein [Paenibacillus sacheonensis]MBM7567556.1 ferredoxin [Paenibacillus sacheonensis]NBC71339.1 2Fe-2S iron-sulfur cluster binding domain-containing protein [Paenibacillus sacheonensis]